MELFIGVPVYREAHPAHEAACEATLRHFGGRAVLHRQPGDSCLSRARAALLGAFLRYERAWTHFLQTDDDQSWDPAHLAELCSLDVPVVGLPCAFKSDKPQYAGRSTVRGLPGPVRVAPDGTVPVRFLGGGFILWRRDVLQALCQAHPELAYRTNVAGCEPEPSFWLWGTGVAEGEGLSEDYWACHLAAELGYEIRCHTRYASPHWSGDADDPSTWRAWVPKGFEAPTWEVRAAA